MPVPHLQGCWQASALQPECSAITSCLTTASAEGPPQSAQQPQSQMHSIKLEAVKNCLGVMGEGSVANPRAAPSAAIGFLWCIRYLVA